MRAFVPFLSILIACSGEEPPTASRSAPILGGVPSGDMAVVALTNGSGSISCSGTLISSKVVLTAGHCTFGFRPVFAFFGSYTPLKPGIYIGVGKAFSHPDYTPFNFRFADIGIVVLDRRAPFTPREWNTVPLDASWPGKTVRMVGFGFQQPASAPERDIGEKREILVPITQLVEEKEFEYFMGTCNGDSGGPAFFRFPDGVERVIGVTSYGRGGCTGDSGSHRVDRYDAFIRAQIAAYDPPSCDRDHRCVSGCAEADPDCPCAPDDGFCSALCEDPDADPDCPPGCGGGGACTTGCAAPDPDCGDPCQADGFCIEDCPARDPDCAVAVGAGETCASDFSCAPGHVCAADAERERLTCTPTCVPGESSCGDGLECRIVAPATAACVAPREILSGFRGAGGCAAAPVGRRGVAWPSAALLLASAAVMWARRRSGYPGRN